MLSVAFMVSNGRIIIHGFLLTFLYKIARNACKKTFEKNQNIAMCIHSSMN